eukprot:scaffold363_cov331-Pavlova_lutheri.AAC.4
MAAMDVPETHARLFTTCAVHEFPLRRLPHLRVRHRVDRSRRSNHERGMMSATMGGSNPIPPGSIERSTPVRLGNATLSIGWDPKRKEQGVSSRKSWVEDRTRFGRTVVPEGGTQLVEKTSQDTRQRDSVAKGARMA